MNSVTVEESEVMTSVEKDNLTLIVEGLQAAKEKLSGPDLAKISLKVNRGVSTVQQYMKGDVRDEELGLLILNYANGFIALNNDCEFQKNKLKY